jgi:hypothetical protein
LRPLERRVDRHLGAREHRLEQLRLAGEVVVDRAARHAGRVGDLGERCVAHTARAEHLFRRVQHLFAGGRRLFLGPSNHHALWGF